MALMYPRTLLAADVKSKAEEYVFEQLRDQLDDEWECFHSASWMIKDPEKGAEDGEADFVVAHPDKGIICLEVKGGGIECRHGEWFRIEKGGLERMKDPFAQALDHRYNLSRLIEKVDGWRRHDLFLVQAVVLPDITVHKLVLAPDAPAEIIIDSKGVLELEESLERVLRFHRGAKEKRKPPGEAGMAMLRDLLAKDVRIEATLGSRIGQDEHEIITLTQDQAKPLTSLAKAPRLAIRGCAGSGKTMIAVERAKQLASEGKEVGFICFNRALRDHLRERYPDSGVTFQTFHGLCVQLGHQAGIEMPDYPPGEAPQTYWDDELPEILVDAVEELGAPFDALLVDEAQDLANHWLDALRLTLRDPDSGLLWLFLDPSQEVYGSRLEVPAEFTPYDLLYNCRNTKQIAREVAKKYRGEPVPKPLGPDGVEVELLHTDDQPATVAAAIERLCGDEEVLPQDVVVLSSHGMDNSAVAESGSDGMTFTKDYKPIGKYVRFSSIRGFKGLESPVVILCELEDLDAETMDEQLYVGFSRAKSHCMVVAPPAA